MKPNKPLFYFALGSLILLAAALRFFRLGAQDIWGDEAFSIFLSQQPITTVVAGASDTHPPFYPLILFFWLKWVGDSAFATRTLSVLIGILAVPLVFVLAKRLSNRSRVPWFAAILTTVSPLLIYYSQETRMYEWVTALALGSVYFCLMLFPAQDEPYRGRGENAWGVKGAAYFLSTLLAIYTHYSAFFVLAAENIFVLLYWWRQRHNWGWGWLRDWALAQAFLIVCYVPWIIVQTSFLRGKANARFDEWSWRGVEMIFGKTFLSFAIGLTTEFPVAQIAAAFFLLFVVLGVIAVWRRREWSAWIAPLYFIVPVAIAFILNPIMPFFFERYVLVALPGFILCAARGLDWLSERMSPMRVVVGAAAVLVAANGFALSNYYFNDAYAKGKYGQMMAYITANARPGDAIILNNPLQKPLYAYYAPKNLPAYYLPDGVPLEDPQSRRQLDDIANTHSRVWLVMFGNPAEYDPTGYLERWLGANAFKTFSRGYVDAALSLYGMPGTATPVQRALRATLGESIQLIGYDLDRAEPIPGQVLQLTLHWQATAPISKRYTVFAHIIGGINPATQSPVWAQLDNEPVGGSRPTTTWQIGETLNDRYGLMLPPDVPPGEYTLEVGMYDPATLERLPVRDENGKPVEDNRVILGTLRVLTR